MKRVLMYSVLAVLLMLAIPAAAQGGIIFQDDFRDTGSGWEVGTYVGGDVGYGNGYYLVTSNGGGDLMWGLAGRNFQNITIDVDATQTQAPSNDNNGYGVMCNVQSDGKSGYLLRISGDGFASIAIVQDNTFTYLYEWTPVSGINLGNATNHVQAVCADGRLALYSNGNLVAETSDRTYTSGDIALVATSYEENQRTEIHYTNLVVTGPDTGSDIDTDTDTDTDTDIDMPEGTVLFQDDFSTQTDLWPTFDNKRGGTRYENDAYLISSTESGVITYAYYDGESFTDTITEVEITQMLAPANDNNSFGVLCRVQPNQDDSYYALRISGDGFANIMRSDPNNNFNMLVEWTPISTIIQGNSTNVVRAVCVGTQLALYINDQLAIQTTDSTYTEGYVGLSASTYEDEDTLIMFDNLLVSSPGGGSGGGATSGLPAQLTDYAGGWQAATRELAAAGAIPDGQLLFQEDRAFFSGQGSFFTPMAADSPRTNFVMAAEVTYTPSGAEAYEHCGLMAHIVTDAGGTANTFLQVGVDSDGDIYYADFVENEDGNFQYHHIADGLGTPHHYLFIANGDRISLYLDGALVFEDLPLAEHAGGFGIGMSGQGPAASCVGEDIWVYELFTPFSSSECSVRSGGPVNRRTGPGTSFGAAGQTVGGQSYSVIDSRVGSDGYTWWQLDDESWVRHDVVEEIGACGPTVP